MNLRSLALPLALALAVAGGLLGTAAGLAIVRGLVAAELIRVPRVGAIGVAARRRKAGAALKS